MGRTRIDTQLLAAVTDPERKDKAIRDILLEMDARIGKIERAMTVFLLLLGTIAGGTVWPLVQPLILRLV